MGAVNFAHFPMQYTRLLENKHANTVVVYSVVRVYHEDLQFYHPSTTRNYTY